MIKASPMGPGFFILFRRDVTIGNVKKPKTVKWEEIEEEELAIIHAINMAIINGD